MRDGGGRDVKGGWIWFIAGIAVAVIVSNDDTSSVVEVVFGLISAVAIFLGALELGPLAVVVLVVGVVLGVQWSERTRGRQEADAAWEKRSSYRKK